MRSYKNILLGCLVLLGAYSCKPNLEGYLPSSGEADFSTYVSIGNSLTAGFADGALSRNGQYNSFTKMLADRFAEVGGGTYNIPYLPTGNGNDGSGGTQRVLRYVVDCQGTTSVTPVPASGSAASLASVSTNGPFNALGIPGARSVDATLGAYSGLNPFLARMVPNPGFSSILSEALRLNPSFFTLWLGSNDVIGYATNGGTGNVDPAIPFPGDLTNPLQVAGSLNAIVDSLTNRGAKGAIANIPDITSLPYFTTIPWNGVVLTAQEAATLNATYAAVGLSNIVWQEGVNPFVIEDTAVVHPTLRIRHAKPNELILLTTPGDSLRCAQWGVSPLKALGDQYVLDEREIADIESHIVDCNNAIANIASNHDIALVDMNAYMKTLTTGMIYNGVELNTGFISGGAFSLDGIHPNPRGYALVANEFIRAINGKYSSTLPEMDVTAYDGVIFP